jgi:CBS domain-containing protein
MRKNVETTGAAMNASDIMSSSVISVGPRTPVVQVAAMLREHRIGGLPVLLENDLVGIVTEKDLLHRHEIDTERSGQAQAWWRRVTGHRVEPDWYVKSHGRCASHVMTARVIVVAPDTSLREISGLFDAHRIGRVPVIAAGRVVGIVTCADLVRALASRPWGQASGSQSDEQIRDGLLAELGAQDWWNGGLTNVLVENGVVLFNGFVENEAQRRASQVAAENIDGVRRVKDERQLVSELPTMF